MTSDGDAESEDMKASVLEGKYQLVFISPEQLIENKRFRCMEVKSTALVVDEVHCVKNGKSLNT